MADAASTRSSWSPSTTPASHYVDAHWGERDALRSRVPGFRREDVAGTDHNFTSLWSQERVSDSVTEHLTSRDEFVPP